jgi:hypothetical protein
MAGLAPAQNKRPAPFDASLSKFPPRQSRVVGRVCDLPAGIRLIGI